MNSEIKSMPFSWNDNLSEVAIEDFQLIQKDLPYLTCQSIGMALAKLELLEKQGCKVDEENGELITDADAPKKCHNINTDYAECDQFVCSNCGIELQDWHSVERDEDDGDITYHDYTFHYCPNCGCFMSEGEKE